MTTRLRGKSGEAVMLILMGAMILGGIVVWLATGHFHMMGMHGGKHTKEETVTSVPHDAQEVHAASPSKGHLKAAGEQDTEEK